MSIPNIPNRTDSRLAEFIAATKSQGASDEFLAAMLSRRGWPLDDVYAALADFWAQRTGVEAPQRAASPEAARDAFFHLLSFVTLAIWATALGAVLFDLANFLIPDPISGYSAHNLRSVTAWNLAALGVAFPIYLLAMRVLFSEARKTPERLQSGIRKWLTYLALLGTAGAVIGDLILFLGYFLLGELTSRFLVKEAIVLAICGGIFAYYLTSLRWDRDTAAEKQRACNRNFAALALAAVLSTFIAGIAVGGTPATQRMREADRQQVRDLQTIAQAIHDRYNRRAAGEPPLPPTLAALKEQRYVERISSPGTGGAYLFHPKGENQYELCATFSMADGDESNAEPYRSPFWKHGAGVSCYLLDASTTPPL